MFIENTAGIIPPPECVANATEKNVIIKSFEILFINFNLLSFCIIIKNAMMINGHLLRESSWEKE
jgi:hypothetical protein